MNFHRTPPPLSRKLSITYGNLPRLAGQLPLESPSPGRDAGVAHAQFTHHAEIKEMPRPTSTDLQVDTAARFFSALAPLYPPRPSGPRPCFTKTGVMRSPCELAKWHTLTRSSTSQQTHSAPHKTVSTTTFRSLPDTHRISSASHFRQSTPA